MSESGEVLAVVLEAVYACAADPDRWEDLIDIFVPLNDHLSAESLDLGGGIGVEQTLRSHLDRAQAVARRLNVSDAPVAAITQSTPQVAYLLIGRDNRLLAATPSATPLLASFSEPLAIGRMFALSDPANHSRYRIARNSLKEGTGTAPVLFNFDDGEATESLSGFLVDAAHFERLIGQDSASDPQAHALILPDRTALLRHDHLLRSSLGLTPAELRLASLLKDGASINEAAPKLGIAVNTARNHLRSIFAKLGVNRQSEMVRHLSELGQLAAFVRGAEINFANDVPLSTAPQNPTRILTERKSFTLADGRKLAYREYGRSEGIPVVFLHAVLSSSLLRDAESDFAFSKGVRIVVVERPGTGRSTPDQNMSFESVGRDIAALVDHLGLSNLYVLGRSSGAVFALEAAKVLGSRVTRLMLWAPRFRTDIDLQRRDPLGRFYAGMQRMPWYADAVLALLRAKLSQRFVKDMMLRSHERSPADHALMRAEPELLDFMVRQTLEALEVTHAGVIREAGLMASDRPIDLEGVQSEIIVWHGGDDGYVQAADVERRISNLPLDEFKIIEGEGHIFSLASRAKVLERLIA